MYFIHLSNSDLFRCIIVSDEEARREDIAEEWVCVSILAKP